MKATPMVHQDKVTFDSFVMPESTIQVFYIRDKLHVGWVLVHDMKFEHNQSYINSLMKVDHNHCKQPYLLENWRNKGLWRLMRLKMKMKRFMMMKR